MVRACVFAAVAATAALFGHVLGHPGENPLSMQKREESMRKQAFSHYVASTNKRALETTCGISPGDKAARQERAMERRLAKFKELREKRGFTPHLPVQRRSNADFARFSTVHHDKTGSLKLSSSAPSKEVFASNTSCVLTPDNADGPYFVWGEQVRSELVEKQPGVPMHIELQFVDVHTCKPAQNLLVDVWACNATGVYSGVSAAGEAGLGSTFLRGVQATDSDGVVNFQSNFPGHYQGRATHQHVIVHAGAQLQPNGSYTGGHVAHLSQLFFDQALINAVEATPYYKTNTIPRTANSADLFTGYAASSVYDPFPNYVLLGNAITDGLFVWAEIGIDTTSNYDSYAPPASWDLKEGAFDNPQFYYEQIMAVVPPPTHG